MYHIIIVLGRLPQLLRFVKVCPDPLDRSNLFRHEALVHYSPPSENHANSVTSVSGVLSSSTIHRNTILSNRWRYSKSRQDRYHYRLINTPIAHLAPSSKSLTSASKDLRGVGLFARPGFRRCPGGWTGSVHFFGPGKTLANNIETLNCWPISLGTGHTMHLLL